MSGRNYWMEDRQRDAKRNQAYFEKLTSEDEPSEEFALSHQVNVFGENDEGENYV